ncbi:adenylate kinase 3 [Monoraphidium neglectum]|uniref:adenylate kinase n=1 Tax=Monoraphidium neglectum TaxID=145388 RepID=A0A0D2LW28_9CHLO|nr:adenylate kinase 3 [Monoraphidium neglectum]KIY93766.1 adenylate kinase 3 [Monoraphidium neglectum]|eukprot:XP_013892786.1 adenylate kinase 3 [Monoraphidium neglectum]
MISGAPAAGKGTQCEKIVGKYGLVHISAGDLLREQVALGTAAGKRAKDFMERGVLVPDDVIVDMIKDRLAQQDVAERGWLLDGYPRSASQAEAIEKEGIRPDLFLLIEACTVVEQRPGSLILVGLT